ncbi:MAG: choice-of-anchor J domain-containing protein [Sodaliphilus sp.]|nr:choice-of-anchor J domain-containing protein [Sodaliphilus sp.]
MNKLFKLVRHLTMSLFAMATLIGTTANAERLLTENFEYELGNLYSQGGWLKYGTQAAGPVQVTNNALTYPDYQDKAVGKAVHLTQVASGEDLMRAVSETAISSGKVYLSALVKVNAVADDQYFLAFIQPTSAGIVDKKTPPENTRLIASKGSVDGKFVFKISRNSATLFESTEEFELGKTYLVVMSYEFKEGTKNDVVQLWVNPAVASTEPQPNAAINSATHTGADMKSFQAIELRQGSSATKVGPEVIVDAIRVGTAWTDLFDVASTEPTMTVTPTVVYDGSAVAIGSSTTFATYAVEYANLENPIDVYLTGANRNQFEVSAETIPAGSGKATITLTYKPQAIGKHTARINFESTVSTLNTGFAATGIAWDPENPPTIVAHSEGLTPFTCKAGEQQKQTITVTTSDLPDYGKAAVKGLSNGAFIISTATLLKNGNTQINITFKPLVPGDYEEVIEFSGIKATTETIRITGTATENGTTEDREGDRLPLDDSKPLASYVQNFDGVIKNKPLSIEGWKNLAQVGNRAWWGYTWADGNGAAKVTPYDSKMEETTPCVMTLVSPALDFKNTPNPVLTFKVMGTLMRDGMADQLEVCYIEKDGEGMYVQPIDGLNIPASPDKNEEWVPYTIDLKGLDLADVFFIGFRFNSSRGAESTTSYYIDDFSWGQTNVPLIRPNIREGSFRATAGKKAISPDIEIEGIALTSDIKISLYGAHKGFFTLSTTTLPAAGGKFNLDFLNTEPGEYAVEVDLNSEGAPLTAVIVGVQNETATGITDVIVDLSQPVSVYDIQGRVLITNKQISSTSELKSAFGEGIYIVKQGEKACKVKL